MEERRRHPLDGRVAVVTGGGKGIGRAIAVGLAEAGANVAVVGRTAGTLEATVGEVERRGGRGLALRADLTEVVRLPALFEEVRARLGGFDILVNSAGVQGARPSLEVTEEQWDAQLDTNLKALFFCCQAAGRIFIEQGHGKIINLGSTFAIVGSPGFAAYCASKGGVLQLTRVLASEWAPLGVNVNAIGPAAVRTEMMALLLDDPEYLRDQLSRLPAGRLVDLEDCAAAAVFLAGPDSDMVHGHLLMIDAGYTAI